MEKATSSQTRAQSPMTLSRRHRMDHLREPIGTYWRVCRYDESGVMLSCLGFQWC